MKLIPEIGWQTKVNPIHNVERNVEEVSARTGPYLFLDTGKNFQPANPQVDRNGIAFRPEYMFRVAWQLDTDRFEAGIVSAL